MAMFPSSECAWLKDFAPLRLTSSCPLTRQKQQLSRAQRWTPGREWRARGQGLPLYSTKGDSKTSRDTRSVRSVGRLRLKAHSSAGTLLTPQRRHMRGTPAAESCFRSWRSFNSRRLLIPVMDPDSTLDIGTGSNPVRGPCQGLGVFILMSLSTCHRAAILLVAYRCGQARGTLNMKLLNASKLPRTAKIAG